MTGARRFTLRFLGRINYLKIVRDFVKEVLEPRHLDAITVHSVVSAVDEALANVITHAYGDSGGEVALEFLLDEDSLSISIRHRGSGFDPSTLPEPNLQKYAAEGRKGGLGIRFMRQFMDEVAYVNGSDGLHEWRLRKRLPVG